MLSVDGTFPNRSRSGDSFALGQKCKRRSTSSKKMPHVTLVLHKMGRDRSDAKKKKKLKRNRSDLTIDEFGAQTRNKDNSLSGHNMSPHWNEKQAV